MIDKFSRLDFWSSMVIGEIVAILSLPILKNLKVFDQLVALLGGHLFVFLILWTTLLPLVTLVGIFIIHLTASERWPTVFNLSKYGIIGGLNLFLGIGIFNLFVLITGIADGLWATFFLSIAFVVTLTNGFFWNKFWTFKAGQSNKTKREYGKFFLVTGTTYLIDITIFNILINVIGPPGGFSQELWANVSLVLLIPVSALGNFIGYKFIVFKL